MAETMAECVEKINEKQPRIAKKVLFVQNLPYDTKDDEFEKAFSDVGPTRKCFLIREKDSSRKCRGFGYVTFAFEEDAQKAKDTVTTLKGRPLRITFSEKKPRKKRERKSSTEDNHQPANDDGDDDDDVNNNQEKRKRKPKSERSNPQTDVGRTVLLFGLPSTISSKQVYKRCRKVGEIEKTVFPLEGRDDPVASLTFMSPKIARIAANKLNKKTIKGKEVTAVLKSKENQQSSKKCCKKSRLIVRNLSFKCTEGLLREVFSQCDETAEVHIPIDKKHNRHKGFGFVHFSNVFSAAKALKELNMKEVLGRPMAVDWAVTKEQYELVQKSRENNDSMNSEGTHNSNSHLVDVKENDANSNNDGDDGGGGDDDDDDGGGNDDDTDVYPKRPAVGKDGSSEERIQTVKRDDQSWDNDSNSDNDDDTDDEEEEEDNEVQMSNKSSSDVKQGLTLFIRNVNYDTTQESLNRLFKKYGDLAYCKIVFDPVTEHSKGTAFVKFISNESVEKCMDDSNNHSDAFFLDGYKLQVDIAVTRGKAAQLSEENRDSKTEPKDKRNLYLSREGVIIPGSEAANELSKADLLKRQKAEAEKKTKLQNPNYFVSTTRLCVRNLPLQLSEAEVKKVFSTAATRPGGKPATVKNMLIMRNKERVNSKGQGRSLGFGFIEFTDHKDALMALRSINNNPNIFGSNRRPIVEFSIENSLALKAKQQRLIRNRNKQQHQQQHQQQHHQQQNHQQHQQQQKQHHHHQQHHQQQHQQQQQGNKTNKEKRQEKVSRRREKRKLQKERKAASKSTGAQDSTQQRANTGAQDSTQQPQQRANTKKSPCTDNSVINKQKSFFAKHPKFSGGKEKTKQPITEKALPQQGSEGKRSNKRKAKDIKEETEFNSIVQKYKNKLLGEKRARWFE